MRLSAEEMRACGWIMKELPVGRMWGHLDFYEWGLVPFHKAKSLERQRRIDAERKDRV